MQPQFIPITSTTHLNQNPSNMYQEIQDMPQQYTQQSVPMTNNKNTSTVTLYIYLI
jgi:hypothetical protein